jgi:hypothetical protein
MGAYRQMTFEITLPRSHQQFVNKSDTQKAVMRGVKKPYTPQESTKSWPKRQVSTPVILVFSISHYPLPKSLPCVALAFSQEAEVASLPLVPSKP